MSRGIAPPPLPRRALLFGLAHHLSVAVAVANTDLTEFVVTNAVDAARRLLADRDRFELDTEALGEWERINARRARDLPGLRRLMERPTSFVG